MDDINYTVLLLVFLVGVFVGGFWAANILARSVVAYRAESEDLLIKAKALLDLYKQQREL